MDYYSNIKFNNNTEKDIEQFEQQKLLLQLSSLLNKLYQSLNPNCPNNYKLPKNFQNLLQRILSTNFSIMKNDESTIINSLLEKVYKLTNENKEALNKFQYLYSKLTKKKNLTKRWAILYLLNAFSKNNLKKLNFTATNDLQQNYLEDGNNLLENNNCIDFLFLNNSNQNIQDDNINFINKYDNNFDYNDCNAKCSNKCKKYLNNLSPKSNINEKYCENENLIICNDKLNNNKINNNYYSPIIIDTTKTSLTITEKDIINDLLYVFEGINGKYIAYDASEDAFILNKLMPWSEEIYNIVNSLSELGWLYKKIKMYIDYYKTSNIKSQFVQSFIYSIQNELDEYFKLISFFRKMNSNNRNGNEIGKKDLNLKNLILWTLKPKEKLKWIASCCESIHSLKGPAILSQIYSFVNYGGCGEYLNTLLNDVSKPFINFIINWIKYGELQDPYKEFFVDILDGIKDDDIWNLKYQIIGKNIPNFMKREPTLKIFEVGKCIHFIRNYCKENYNLSHLKNILTYLIDKCEQHNKSMNGDIFEEEEKLIKYNNFKNIKFDYGFDDDKIIYEIESINSCYEFINYLFNSSNQTEIFNISFINKIINNIDIIHKLINKDLVRILLEKFNFLSNLESINKYLLLGQGDMMQTLMESLFEELDKPSNLILKHNLQSNLESAIRASNAHFKDKDNIKKLDIKLLSPSPADSGWDIFCLEYKVDLPLNIIFNSKLLKDYQKLFLFFWKIKHIKFSQINHILKKIKNISINSKKHNLIKKIIRLCIHFNQEIVHFITNLHNYFALEVLETQYKQLKNDLSKINSLDELISKHKKFLNNIKKQCLLDEDSVTINKKIISIFDIILRFKTAFDILSSFLGEINFEDNDNLYINHNNIKNIKEYFKQIIILYQDYQKQIIDFINLIKLIGKNNLKYLSMKIDYNYFYSFIEKDEEDKKNLLAIKKINDEKEKRRILNYEDVDDYNNDNDDNDNENNDDNDNNENNDDNDDDNDDNNNIINNNSKYIINNNEKNYNDINEEEDKKDGEDRLENEEGKEEEENNTIDNYNNIKNNIKYNHSNSNSNYSYKNKFSKADVGDQNKLDKKYSYENKYKDYSSNLKNSNSNNINKNRINYVDDKVNKMMYMKKNQKNDILDDDNNYLNSMTKSKNYNISNNSNNVSNNNSYKYSNNNLNDYSNNNLKNSNSFNEENDTKKTYQYNNDNKAEKGLTYNYNNNGQIKTNLEDIEDEDKIITSVKPKIYGISTRSKGNKNK